MTSPLTTDQILEASKLEQSAQFCWLIEIEIPLATVARYRLNNSAHDVEFGTDGQGAAFTYSPLPFKVSGIRSDSQGGIYTATVTASNVTRELMAAVEVYDGLIGQPARIMLVHKALLGSGKPLLEIAGDITTHRASATDIAFVIGREDHYATPLPLLRVDHDYCAHPYGGVLCGYNTDRSGAMQTCSFLVEGANGCREHGDDEVAAGEDLRHPLRFGGQRGVPRRAGKRL